MCALKRVLIMLATNQFFKYITWILEPGVKMDNRHHQVNKYLGVTDILTPFEGDNKLFRMTTILI